MKRAYQVYTCDMTHCSAWSLPITQLQCLIVCLSKHHSAVQLFRFMTISLLAHPLITFLGFLEVHVFETLYRYSFLAPYDTWRGWEIWVFLTSTKSYHWQDKMTEILLFPINTIIWPINPGRYNDKEWYYKKSLLKINLISMHLFNKLEDLLLPCFYQWKFISMKSNFLLWTRRISYKSLKGAKTECWLNPSCDYEQKAIPGLVIIV